MKTVIKWGCSAAACLCCGLFTVVATTVGGAAARHQSIGRGLYMVLLLVFMLLAWIMFNLPSWLDSAHYIAAIPSFKGCDGSTGAAAGDSSKIVSWLMQHEFGEAALSVPERLCYGTLSVLRVMLSLTLFHALMALFMVGEQSSNRASARYELQHSWWSVKIIILVLFVVCAFLAVDNTWINAYNWFAFMGSLLFMLVQVLLLIEFAHRTSERLSHGYRRAAAAGRPLRCAVGSGLILVIVAAYVGAVVLLGMTFALVGSQTSCSIAWTISIGTAFLCAVVTLGAIAAHRSSRGGIVPAAVIVLYCAYLTWSSLSPMALRNVGCIQVSAAAADDAPGLVYMSNLVGLHDMSHDAQHIIMLGTAFIALLYAAMRSSARVSSTDETIPAEGEEKDDMSLVTQLESGADEDALPTQTIQHYNFSLFHLIFMLAACYAAMVLTGWSAVHLDTPAASYSSSSSSQWSSTHTSTHSPGATELIPTIFINHTTNSLWIKAASSWFTLFLYMWTACAPLVCRRCRTQ
jgi:hypothetical protein